MQDVKEILIEYIKDNQEKLYRIAFSYSKNEEAAPRYCTRGNNKGFKKY